MAGNANQDRKRIIMSTPCNCVLRQNRLLNTGQNVVFYILLLPDRNHSWSIVSGWMCAEHSSCSICLCHYPWPARRLLEIRFRDGSVFIVALQRPSLGSSSCLLGGCVTHSKCTFFRPPPPLQLLRLLVVSMRLTMTRL